MAEPIDIGIDARVIFDQERRGIAHTCIHLIRFLAQERPDWRFSLFHREPAQDQPFADYPQVRSYPLQMRGDRWDLWQRVRLPGETFRRRLSLFYSPTGILPWIVGCPAIATIHDTIPGDVRGHLPSARKWTAMMLRTAQQARQVVTASEHSRSRILALSRLPTHRVSVVPWASCRESVEEHAPSDEVAEVLKTPFVLHYGLKDPRKGTDSVLSAWALLPEMVRQGQCLVITGLSADLIARYRSQYTGLVDTGSLVLFGYLASADVAHLAARARLLLYPTSYEGFGIPIVDAFEGGVPVLGRYATSVPEVAGAGAVLVEPYSSERLAKMLAIVLTDARVYEALQSEARRRASLFSWAATARQYATIMEKAIAR